jgi:hypothetical protein
MPKASNLALLMPKASILALLMLPAFILALSMLPAFILALSMLMASTLVLLSSSYPQPMAFSCQQVLVALSCLNRLTGALFYLLASL